MGHNLLVLALVALIPLVVGSAWYSPLLFAKAWMAAVKLTPDDAKKANMPLNMLLLYIFSFLIATVLMFNSIHQFGFNSMLGDPQTQQMLKDHANSEIYGHISAIWNTYGHHFRTYRHGAFHGVIISILFALPLIASGALFEQRGFKYVMITWGFWFVNIVLMSAILCHWIIFEMV